MTNNEQIISQIEEKLLTVFDPEFPIMDIFTMWLIYEIKPDLANSNIEILMTLTSPTCPAWDQIQSDIKNAIRSIFPDTKINITITFEPMRSLEMIKDQDLRRMFE